MKKDDVYLTRARRCRRCGGVLISEQGIRDGYGSSCIRKMQEEAAKREQMRNQCSIFDEVEEKEEKE